MSWAERAAKKLDDVGYRRGKARRQVIELLAEEACALTALEMDRRLPAGRASIYRTLEQLEELHLVQRIDIGGDASGYERLDTSGHHHHLICEECGSVEPFADQGLEKAIDAVSRASDFAVQAHDVILRGTCPSCARQDA